jgi:hypothetical protein
MSGPLDEDSHPPRGCPPGPPHSGPWVLGWFPEECAVPGAWRRRRRRRRSLLGTVWVGFSRIAGASWLTSKAGLSRSHLPAVRRSAHRPHDSRRSTESDPSECHRPLPATFCLALSLASRSRETSRTAAATRPRRSSCTGAANKRPRPTAVGGGVRALTGHVGSRGGPPPASKPLLRWFTRGRS